MKPGPPASLTLNPGSATITAGDNSQPYQATGKDAHGNSLGDATSRTAFTIAPDGSCTTTDPKTCTATIAGPHTVTGTIDLGDGVTVTGTATLTVKPGPPVSLTLNSRLGHHHRRAPPALPGHRQGRPRQLARRPDQLHRLHHRP